MKNMQPKKELVNQFLSSTSKDFEYFVQHSMDFSIQLSSYLKKAKSSQKEFAALLGKEESEISKWLSGNHNFTLRSISKIEAALNKQLIFTRDEIIERFLPFIFRNWEFPFVDSNQLDSLITYYTFSESADISLPMSFSSSTNIELTPANELDIEKTWEQVEIAPNTDYNDDPFLLNKAA